MILGLGAMRSIGLGPTFLFLRRSARRFLALSIRSWRFFSRSPSAESLSTLELFFSVGVIRSSSISTPSAAELLGGVLRLGFFFLTTQIYVCMNNLCAGRLCSARDACETLNLLDFRYQCNFFTNSTTIYLSTNVRHRDSVSNPQVHLTQSEWTNRHKSVMEWKQ